jgi:hypothetical protein
MDMLGGAVCGIQARDMDTQHRGYEANLDGLAGLSSQGTVIASFDLHLDVVTNNLVLVCIYYIVIGR